MSGSGSTRQRGDVALSASSFIITIFFFLLLLLLLPSRPISAKRHSQEDRKNSPSNHNLTFPKRLPAQQAMTTNPGHKPEQPSRAAVSPHGREHRLRRTLHRGWEAICISTALCDFCGRRSRGVVQKCLRCGLSICSPCSRAGALGGNRNHRLDHDAVCWDGAALQTGRGRGARHLVVSPTEPDAPARKQQLDRRRGLARSHAATIQDERGGRQRRRGRCEMATQTPSAWWLAVQTGRNASLSPDTEVECRVDEQDVAAILARMPLSETVFRRDDPSREQQQFLPRVD